jgi:N-acetylglucosaminyl-diphospho-decaprenol L-rhamnosyltransferase
MRSIGSQSLRTHTARPRFGGGRTVFADRTLNSTSAWRFMSIWSLFTQAFGLAKVFDSSDFFNHEGYGGWGRDEVREVEIVTGCFLLIDRELWEQLHGFDESFFMYGEEADLCYRAKSYGAKPLVTPNATIVHYGGASETARAQKIVRLFTGKVMIRCSVPAFDGLDRG